METNSTEMSLCADMEGSSTTVKVEISECDNPVLYKVVKLEPDEASDLAVPQQPVWMAQPVCIDQGTSNENQSSRLHPSVSLNRVSASFHDANIFKRRHNFENEISTDESTSESDISLNNDSETDSASEKSDGFDESTGAVDPEIKTESDIDIHEDPICDVKNKNVQDCPSTLKWTSDPTSIKKIEFTKNQELRMPPPQTPYEAFCWFLNDDLIGILVEETNKYASRICNKPSNTPKSRFNCWKEVTREEMVPFLGLLIHTGTFRTNMLGDYWKTDYLFNWTCFSKYVKRNRFMLLMTCLNCVSPTCTRSVIGQTQPIIKNFNETMAKIYYPGKELFLANTKILWRGRLVRQFGKLNPSKDVINLHMLAEPNGPVIKYHVHSSDTNTNLLRATTGQIVKELLQDYLGNGHAVYMNRCYSSRILAEDLLGCQTYCTGILNKHSRDNLFRDPKFDLPESNQSFFVNGIHIGKWNDSKTVLYISTEFDDGTEQVAQGDGTTITKPKAIVNYSKYMTDSELQERLMSYYPSRRKTLRWNQRIFLHSLQIYMNNAYHLYNNYSGKEKLCFHDFRLAVLKGMLPEPTDVLGSVALPKTHVLSKIKEMIVREKKNRNGQYLRMAKEIARKPCLLCVEKQKETRTMYECRGCEGAPGFCASCFCKFHRSRNLS